MPVHTNRVVACITLFVVIAIIAGCSTAGPFVTNISSDGMGNIIVEKNMVKFNPFSDEVSMGDTPSTTVIQVVPEYMLDDDED